jgi:hypothetical protein
VDYECKTFNHIILYYFIMFKKVILVFVAVALTASYAQAQFTFGVRAGLNLTNMVFKDNGATVTGKMKPGIQLGVTGEHAITDAFAIQPGLLFSMQGYKMEEEGPLKGAIALNYIQIPVNVQYKLDLSGMKLLLQAGPYLGIAVNGKFKMKAGSQEDSMDIRFKSSNGGGDYKRGDFGLGVGAGLQFGNIQAAVGYNIGLANVDAHYDGDHTAKNNGLALTVTYLFGK